MKRSLFRCVAAWSAGLLPGFAFLLPADAAEKPEGGITSLAELRAARRTLAAKPRRLIANNDGCDALYFPRNLEPKPANFLDRRTSQLAGTQVGAISYCTISSGFGQFTHDTRVGTVLTRQGADYGLRPQDRNVTADLIQHGTDTLRAVTGFAHANGIESFWSFRMNDTHDAEHRPEKPYFLFPQLKTDHPEWLVGDPNKRTPHGRWSSVDYARPEIRELAFRFVEEVCRNYDVDGIELDFFRHLCYFRSVANGGKADANEVAAMTELMRRIRTATEKEGLRRHRPILVAMRTPDSAAFCLESGLDLATWLKEGLMDLLITTDYFRLNPWEHSVQLGHGHGVKVYPALTDPRVKNETRFKRESMPAYRARAANAWASGADGLYLFNLYDIDRTSPLWRELGDPQALAFTDKLYFVTDLDGRPTAWLAGGDRHQTIPQVTPTNPAHLGTKQAFTTGIMIADDPAAAEKAGRRAAAKLHLELPGLDDAARLSVSLNGHALAPGRLANGWLDLPIAAGQWQKGANEIAMFLAPAQAKPENEWSLTYDGSQPPAKPWWSDKGSERTQTAVQGGALLVADRGTQNGDVLYHRVSWGADRAGETVAEARVKVISGNSYLIFTDGVGGERLQISPTGIALHHNPKLRHAMDTTGDFHTYRVILRGADVQVRVDGAPCIEAPGALAPSPALYPRNELAFGAANSPEQGEALWDEVRFRAARASQESRDVVVSVEYSAR